MSNSSKIFVEVELGLNKAKKEMSELQDFGVSIGIDEKDLKKVNELEKKIEGLENSFDKLSKTKLNTKNFQDAAKQIKTDIDAINKRIDTLSGKFDSIVSGLKDIAGVDTFQKMFQGALEGAKEVADTVKYTVKTVQQVGKVGQVELVTSKDKQKLKEELDIYKEILSAKEKDGKLSSRKKSTETDEEYISRLIKDIEKLYSEYDELGEKASKETDNKLLANFSKKSEEIVKNIKRNLDTIDRVFSKAKKDFKFEKTDFQVDGLQLDNFREQIEYQLEGIYEDANKQINRIEELFNQFQNSIDNGTAGTSKEVNRASKGYGTPLYISTSPSTLTKRIREILEVVQNNIADEPIHVYLDISSDYRKNKYTKQLQEMAVDLTKINNPEIQEKLSKALMDLQEQVAGETVINIKTDVKSAEIEIYKAIKNIRIELNKRENKLHVSPDVKIPQSKIKKIQTELNRISKGLTLNLNNIVISDKAIKDATGNGAKNKQKSLIDAKAIADTAVLANLIDKIVESNKEFLSSDKAIAESLLDIKNIVKDIKINEVVEPIKELVSILYQFTGVMSNTDLDKMFDGIRTDVNDITGALRGNNLKAIKDVLSEYKEYKNAGGSRDISELGGAKNVQNWLNKHINDVEKTGQSFGEKYSLGISNSTPKVENAANNLAQTAKKSVAKGQDSNSPSKDAEKLGNDFGDGYVNGLDNSVSNIEKEVETFLSSLELIKGSKVWQSIEDVDSKIQKYIQGIKEGILDAEDAITDFVNNSKYYSIKEYEKPSIKNDIDSFYVNQYQDQLTQSEHDLVDFNNTLGDTNYLLNEQYELLNKLTDGKAFPDNVYKGLLKTENSKDELKSKTATQLLNLYKEFKENGSKDTLNQIYSITNKSNLSDKMKYSIKNYLNNIADELNNGVKEAINESENANKLPKKTKKVIMTKAAYKKYVQENNLIPSGIDGENFEYNFDKHFQALKQKGLAKQKIGKNGKKGRWSIQVEIEDNGSLQKTIEDTQKEEIEVDNLNEGFEKLKTLISQSNLKRNSNEGKSNVAKFADQYKKYIERGGNRPISELSDNATVVKNLTEEYEKQIKTIKEDTIAIEDLDKAEKEMIDGISQSDNNVLGINTKEYEKNTEAKKDNVKISKEEFEIQEELNRFEHEQIDSINQQDNSVLGINESDISLGAEEGKHSIETINQLIAIHNKYRNTLELSEEEMADWQSVMDELYKRGITDFNGDLSKQLLENMINQKKAAGETINEYTEILNILKVIDQINTEIQESLGTTYLREKGFAFSTNTGKHSNFGNVGSHDSITGNGQKNNLYNASLHTHPDNNIAMSIYDLDKNGKARGDLLAFYSQWKDGIKYQFIRGLKQSLSFDSEKFFKDITSVVGENDSAVKEIIENIQNYINTYKNKTVEGYSSVLEEYIRQNDLDSSKDKNVYGEWLNKLKKDKKALDEIFMLPMGDDEDNAGIDNLSYLYKEIQETLSDMPNFTDFISEKIKSGKSLVNAIGTYVGQSLKKTDSFNDLDKEEVKKLIKNITSSLHKTILSDFDFSNDTLKSVFENNSSEEKFRDEYITKLQKLEEEAFDYVLKNILKLSTSFKDYASLYSNDSFDKNVWSKLFVSNKTPVSSGEGIDNSNINNSVDSIKEESKAFEDATESAQQASKAKDDFAESNQNLAKSAEETKKKIDEQNSSEEKPSKTIGIPEDIKAVLEPEVDKSDWNWVTDKVQELSENLGRVLQIQRDVNGEFESYFVKFEKGNANLGKDSEQQLLRTSQQLLDIQDIKGYKSSADSKIKSINKILQVDEGGNPRTTKYTDEYIEKLEELKKKLIEFQDQLATTDGSDFEELIKINNELEESYQRVAISEKTFDENKKATENSIEGLRAKIEKFSNQNSAMGTQFAKQLDMIRQRLQSGIGQDELRELDTELRRLEADVNAARKTGDSFLTGVWKRIRSISQSAIAMLFSMYDIIRYIRESFSIIKELDTALVDLRKTTSMSSSELNDFYYNSSDLAKQMGVSTKEIINQASAWSRLGYSSKKASETMAVLSSQFASISPGMDTDTAQTGLVSLMKAYNVETEQVERQIMDNINILGNRFAETNEDIIEGMERAGATLSAQGESIQSSFALFTGAQEVIQNAETVGTAIKTLSLRIRGYDEETEELSDDVVEATGKVADLTKTASNNYAGVSLWANANKTQYRDLVDYLRDISEIFDEISPENQTQLLESLFGKRGASVGSAILKNFDQVDKALLTMENSAGSADAEMGIIQDSIEYKLNALKQTWVSTLQGLIDRGDISGIIDALTKISEVLGKIIDSIGVLPALVSTVTAAISIKKGTNIIDFLSSISNSNKIDSAAIEKYNSILKETGNSILAATVASEGQNEATKALLQSQGVHLITTEQEIAANDALAGSMTAASVAGGILKTILSSIGIGIAIAGISALIKGVTKAWDDWNLTVDEAKENLKSWNEEVAKMQDAVDEQKSALEKVKDSYDDYVDGVNTLNNKNINLTNEDYQEFISLNNELAELFPELKTGVDEEGNAILNLGDNAAEAAAKIESLIETQERQNSIDIRTNWDETYENNRTIVESSIDTIEDLKSEQDKLTSVVNEINDNDINGTTLSYSILPEDEGWEYAQDVYNAYMDAYDKIYNSMSETRQEELHDSLYNTSIQSRASNLSKSLRLDFTGWSDEEISNFETELGVFKASILQDIDDLTNSIDNEKSSLDQIYSDWAEQIVSGMHTSNEFLQYATTDEMVDAYETLIRNLKDTEFQKINDEYGGVTEDFLNAEVFTDEMADLLSRSFENEDGEKFSFIDLFDPDISVEDMEFLVSQITSAAAELGIVLPISLQFTGVTNGQISDLAVSAGYARGESYQYKEELKNEAKKKNLSLNLDEMTADEVQEFYDITSGAESVTEQIEKWIEYLKGANDELSETSKYIDQMNNAESFSYGNLDTLMQVYDDVKDAEDFDYSSILNNEDFKTAFKDFDSYEDFIKTITESPNDIKKCQKAFDDLATEAIYASKAFDDLTEDTAEATKKMLEQQGVANADEVVEWVLNVKNAWKEFADSREDIYSTNLSEATEEEIIAFIKEKGVIDETTTAMISFWAAKGNTLTLTTNGDISNLQSLTTQLGITSGALVEYLSVKGKIAEYESKLASGDYTGASRASLGTLLTWARRDAERLQADAQSQLNAALSGNTLNTKTNGSYSGRNSDSSGSSGSDSDSNEPTEIDWIEVKLERLQRAVDNLDKKVEQTWRSWSSRNKNLGKEIKKLTTLYNNQLKAADKYKDKFNSYVKESGLSSSIVKKIKDGSISIKNYDSDTANIIQKAQDYWEKYLKAADDSNETQAEIIEKYVQKFELIEEKYESLIGLIDAKQDYYTTTRKDRIEANGGVMSYKQAAKYYGLLNNKEVGRQAYLKSEQSQLETQLNKLLSKGVSKNSTEYKDLATRLQEVKNAYQESINTVKENTYALLQVHWDEIDNYLSDISHNISDNDFIKNLLDAQGDLVDTDTAKFTDSGEAALATFLSNMEQDQEIVSAINKEIVELQKAYKNGEVGKDAYLERLEDLESQQQDAALDYYSQQDEVKSLWEEMYNALLDNLRDLIDTATNQLNTEKDAYEYQKTIQEKVDAISAYRKQLVALAGDDSEENSSILQKLKNSLNEAEQDLYETEWDRYISETSDVLNELYDNTEEWVNERLDDINGLLMDSNSIVQNGVSTIKTTIEDSISQIGITYLEPISTMLEYLGYGKDNDTKPTDTSTVDTTVSNKNNNSNNNKKNNNDNNKKKKKKNNNDDKKSKGWFFVTNKSDKGNKSLDYNKSIVDRLKYKGYDSSFSNRKKYYSGMGLGKSSAYKGTSSQNSKMLSWMKANGFKVGAKSIDKDQMAWTQEAGQEIIFRKSDGAMLTPLGKGDSVFTAEQTSALWNLSHGMINGFDTGATTIANYPTTFNGGTVNNDINMSITLPNVTNYEEFTAQLKADTSFQKYIQQATLGSALNKNSLLTKRY